jgi:glutamate synthase (NADPH/NADH) small chain
METEGITFKTNANVGVNVSVDTLKEDFDVICLTGGSTQPRDLVVSGRDLDGIHFAMDYLPQQNKRNAGKSITDKDSIYAEGKNVVVIGGGDTGSDCVGTATRQGAKNVIQLELMPMPPKERTEDFPWPTYPMILRTSTSQEEAAAVYGDDPRQYSIATKSFSGENGKVTKLNCIKLNWIKDENGRMKMEEIPGSEFTIDADLVLFAMGFLHPEHKGMLDDLGVEYDGRGNVSTNSAFMTSVEGIFSAGDMRRGQSLVVHAINEGRIAAKFIDEYLMGKTYLRSNA